MLLNRRIPLRYIVKDIKIPLVIIIVLSIVMEYITRVYQHLLPDMPLTIPVFIGTAISIILSFKLSQSYDRWWEARKIWGSIVNDSRTLVIQLLFFSEDSSLPITHAMAERQYKWTFEFGRQLRKNESSPDEYANDAEIQQARRKHNPSLFLLKEQSKDLRELYRQQQIDRLSFLEIDKTLMRLCAAQGMAERIKSTIFPSTYRMYLHSMIYLFVVSLSIALRDVHLNFELPLLLSLASAFFLLERSARDLQDPFEGTPSDIPVTAIALKIRQNIQELLDNPTDKIEPTTKFYEL